MPNRLSNKMDLTSLIFFAVILSLILVAASFLLLGTYHTATTASMKLVPMLFVTLVPTATIFFAVGAILLTSPVHNLLSLISVFVAVVILYIYLEAEYMA
jgi:hypothetical protein